MDHVEFKTGMQNNCEFIIRYGSRKRAALGGPVLALAAREVQISTHFLVFYVKSPEGMTRVDDVRLEDGKLIVEDRPSGKTMTLAASRSL